MQPFCPTTAPQWVENRLTYDDDQVSSSAPSPFHRIRGSRMPPSLKFPPPSLLVQHVSPSSNQRNLSSSSEECCHLTHRQGRFANRRGSQGNSILFPLFSPALRIILRSDAVVRCYPSIPREQIPRQRPDRRDAGLRHSALACRRVSTIFRREKTDT